MSRAAFLGLAVILSTSAVAGRGSQAQTPPIFRAATDVVSVDVTVRSGGQAVAGLTAGDFVVRDNGVVQHVQVLDVAAMPLDVTILADVSSQTRGAWTNQESAAHIRSRLDANVAAIAGILRPVDRLRVLAIDTYVTELLPLQPAAAPIALRPVDEQGLSSTYDALVTAMLAPVEPGRRHLIVAWTKELDTISGIDASDVRDVARQSDAVVYAVQRDFMSNEGPNAAFRALFRTWHPFNRRDPAVLADVAALSGGTFHPIGGFADESAAGAFKAIFDEFRHGYVLQYTPDGVSRAGWHEIVVTVPRVPSADIRARRGYAGADVAATAAAPPARPASVDLARAFDDGDVATFRTALRRVPDLKKTLRDYTDAGTPWASAPRHEAVFTLELANGALFGRDDSTRDAGLALLGREHDLVRQPLGADAFECGWYDAEVALLEGGLLGYQTIEAATNAGARCPDDATLKLARGIATDQLWSIANAVALAPKGRNASRRIEDVLAAYDAVSGDADAVAEARVRAAWAAFRSGAPEAALTRLDAAGPEARDAVVRYLQRLVRAQVLVALDRRDDAARAAADALAVWPGAQSARVTLMDLLVTAGRRDEAAALSTDIETAADAQVDPWWIYWQGDYRGFDAIVARLAEAAR